MSSVYSGEELARVMALIEAHHREYLESGGTRGHVLESFVDADYWVTMLLLRTVGRKTGIVRNTPLGYSSIGGRYVVAATKGGSDEHPHWYQNMKAGGEVAFQIATEAFIADWREATAEERPKLWEILDINVPVFATYRAATTREIPLILLKPKERIQVFTPGDGR